MQIKERILFLALMLIAAINLKAQKITTFTSTDGLPSDDVKCLTSDESNNMWFGTAAGVTKYDGTTWTVFTTTTDAQIPNNSITAIAATKDNKIWIGTDYGAAVYDGTNWIKYTTTDGLGSNRINNIFQAKNGDIWISDFKGVTKYNGSTFTTFGTSDGLPFGGVQDIKETSNGDILMATSLGGLFVYNGSIFKSYTESNGVISNSTSALALAQNGDIWIGTGDGASVFDSNYDSIGTHTRMYLMPPPDTLNPVQDIKIDSRGNVWVGIYVDYLVTVGGVAMFDGNQWVNYDEEDGLAGPTIRKMTLDKNNNVWVGTSAGVSKIESPYLNTKEIVANGLTVYPIPAKDELNITFNNIKDASSPLKIYNSEGQLVMVRNTSGKLNSTIDLTNLDKGFYYIHCNSLVKKIVVN